MGFFEVVDSLGLSQYEQGLYEQALERFFKAVENDLKNSVYYNNRALAFGQLKNYHHALQDFEKALSLSPEDPKVYHNRGNVHSTMGNFISAIDDYQQAINLSNGTKKKYFHSKGIAFEKINKIQEALQSFQKALDIEPEYLPTLFHFGSVHYKIGNYQEAETHFTKVISLQQKEKSRETHKLAWEARGKTFQKLGQHQKALDDLEEAVYIDPENPMFLFLRGISHLELAEISLSLKDFEKAIEFGLLEARVYNYVGIAHKKERNFTLSLHVRRVK